MDEGELVAERYRLESVIGRGAMGVVWLAHDERLEREVAVKQLLLGDSPDQELGTATPEQASAAAMREARIAAKLRHPNAISVHDVVTHGGRPCLVMEYLRSEPLDAVLVSRGGLPPQEAAAIGAQVAAALAAAHTAGIVHRDVKPENILITEDGTAKITDFGVSRAVGVATVTTTGILAGTPAYLAPEVAGGAQATPRSDVFSLGATLYAVIEGLPPFGIDDNPIALLHRVAAGELTPPRRAGELTELLLWLLRRDPAERPTMKVAHEALSTFAAGRSFPVPRSRAPTVAMPAPPQAHQTHTPRRGLLIAIGAAGVALLVGGVLLGVALRGTPSGGAAAAAPPSSTTTAAPSTSQRPIVAGGTCVASYDVVNSWPGGYQVSVTVRNDGDTTLEGWAVRWRLPAGHGIRDLWNGRLTEDGAGGTDVTVSDADWNTTVPAGGQTTFGFNATTPGTPNTRPVPTITCQPQ
ncbi:protein kinase domain-containing protein [Actinophytocola sp.]|uniref:protein kinase domain-containing protein n=1 Tax=Actinophytocola sp. TaxID=1872138 RepID=UPI003899A4AC